jgi:hypothetical protein
LFNPDSSASNQLSYHRYVWRQTWRQTTATGLPLDCVFRVVEEKLPPKKRGVPGELGIVTAFRESCDYVVYAVSNVQRVAGGGAKLLLERATHRGSAHG